MGIATKKRHQTYVADIYTVKLPQRNNKEVYLKIETIKQFKKAF